MDTSNMQGMMTQVSGAQQSVIQGGMPMNQHDSPSRNSLQYTATIYSQDMTAANQNSHQQMLSMHQNRQQQNEQSAQAMMSDLNPFISGGMNMGQQQAQQSGEQMSSSTDDNKEGYKEKYSRLYSRPQLP